MGDVGVEEGDVGESGEKAAVKARVVAKDASARMDGKDGGGDLGKEEG